MSVEGSIAIGKERQVYVVFSQQENLFECQVKFTDEQLALEPS